MNLPSNRQVLEAKAALYEKMAKGEIEGTVSLINLLLLLFPIFALNPGNHYKLSS